MKGWYIIVIPEGTSFGSYAETLGCLNQSQSYSHVEASAYIPSFLFSSFTSFAKIFRRSPLVKSNLY